MIETPSLAGEVASRAVPPIAKRIPADPLVVTFGDDATSGQSGGELHTLIGGPRDTRLMVVWGYARLVGYAPDLHLHPDLAERIDVADARDFTIHLRPGHRWSDGHPFTAEDFRYFWEDMALNRDLSPAGPPAEMLVDGHPPRVAVVDQTTIRYSWDGPNPRFLDALAAAAPLDIYAPAHYLKQFHARYADPKVLEARIRDAGVLNWAALHERRDASYRNNNPDLPTLQPWVLKTRPPAIEYVFARNPYYHRIDSHGHQLPYIDTIALRSVDSGIVPTMTAAGESDLQARYLGLRDYALLGQAGVRNDFDVRLWPTARASNIALYPNLTTSDPVWRTVLRDVRFRRALSLAVNRHDINLTLFYGLATEGNDPALEGSPLYDPNNRSAWAGYDPQQANRLLDSMGLAAHDDDGRRLLPDGRPAILVVEDPGDDRDRADALALVRDDWRKVGIALLVRHAPREIFYERVRSGDAKMSVFFGAENGLPTPDSSPAEWAPTSGQQLQWPQWGSFTETHGKIGQPIDVPPARELLDLYRHWDQASSARERAIAWRQILAINADQAFVIGLVSAVPQPVVVRKTLHNVPRKGIYNWDPGALFGIYRPDQFWFDRGGVAPRG